MGDIKLAERLKYYRKNAGLSQTDVSEYLHISRQAVSAWETGKTSPDIDTISRLCTLYRVSLGNLLDIEEEEQKEIEQEEMEQREKGSKEESGKEQLALAVLLMLSCKYIFLAIPISAALIFWMKRKKKKYIVIYIFSGVILIFYITVLLYVLMNFMRLK